MAWDFQTLTAEIQNEVDDDGEDLDVIKQLTNDVCRMIWNADLWRFRSFKDQLNTLVGIRTYNLETAFGYAVRLIDSVGYKGASDTQFRLLSEGTEREFDSIYSDTTQQGQPFKFLFDGVTLTIHTAPDYAGVDNLQVHGERSFTELVDDTDVPVIPQDYKHIIKAGAKWLYYHFDDDVRETLDQQQFWIQGMAELRANELDSTTTPKRGAIASHVMHR